MLSRIWLINLGLAVVVIFFGIKALGVWTEEGLPSPEIEAVKSPVSKVEVKKSVKKRTASELVYESVASLNLFSSERNEPKPEETEQNKKSEEKPVDKQPKISGREIILYGVVIMDGYKSALISNPKPESGEKKSKWIKVGDSMGDFEVTAINKESVILAEGAEKYEILLFDKGKAKKRGAVSKQDLKPTVIDTSPKEKPKAQVTTMKVDKRDPSSDVPSKGEKAAKEGKPEEKYRVVDTPFGKTRVKIED